MNVYFEVVDSYVGRNGGKYFAVYNVKRGSVIVDTYRRLGQLSTRIWQEDDTGVKYIKNRFSDIHNTHDIDMTEFMWIKLKSKTV